eukprot:m.434498 g.434498  ORF g.434498 m.434498 type:complete len:144 (+) comp97448_c0_seq1:451-882(+)
MRRLKSRAITQTYVTGYSTARGATVVIPLTNMQTVCTNPIFPTTKFQQQRRERAEPHREREGERTHHAVHSSGPTIVIASVTPTPKILVTQSVLLAAPATNEETVTATLLVASHVTVTPQRVDCDVSYRRQWHSYYSSMWWWY